MMDKIFGSWSWWPLSSLFSNDTTNTYLYRSTTPSSNVTTPKISTLSPKMTRNKFMSSLISNSTTTRRTTTKIKTTTTSANIVYNDLKYTTSSTPVTYFSSSTKSSTSISTSGSASSSLISSSSTSSSSSSTSSSPASSSSSSSSTTSSPPPSPSPTSLSTENPFILPKMSNTLTGLMHPDFIKKSNRNSDAIGIRRVNGLMNIDDNDIDKNMVSKISDNSSMMINSTISNHFHNNNNNNNNSNISMDDGSDIGIRRVFQINNTNLVFQNTSYAAATTITDLIEPFGNNTLFDISDFSEDELLFRMVWNNSTSSDTAGDSFLSLNTTATNVTNATQGQVGDIIDFENTWQMVTTILTTVILGFIILATVIGNVFVIAAILLERNLQSVANYLILSLAVADLLVACLVMPLSAVYEISNEWKLGPELCDMWTSSDVLCCTASILHLVAIALDRYWAVTNIDYVHQRTAGRIGIMILVIWVLSLCVSVAPLFGWKDPEWHERVVQDLQCLVSQDIGYQIFATASSFYVPLLVILVLYWRIYQTARKRIRRRQQASHAQTYPEPLLANTTSTLALTTIGFRWKVSSAPSSSSGGGLIASAAGGSGGIAAAVITVIGRPLPTISETTTAFTNISSANTSPEKCSYGNGIDRGVSGSGGGGGTIIESDLPTGDAISMAYPSSAYAPTTMKSTINRKKAQISADSKRERKAAKTLAIITGAFVFCWLPFFIIAILLPACNSCYISPVLISLFLWLGYFNSTLNPVIYTIFSPEFRHAFKRILCGRKNSIRRRTGVMRR